MLNNTRKFGLQLRGLGNPVIVIDDVKIGPWGDPWFILRLFPLDEIEQVDVARGNPISIIMIYTKTGNWNSPPRRFFNIKPVMPLGYQLPIEFYSPKYETQESIDNPKPDLRTTIYWQPNVITDDKGNAKLDFYTADDPGTYSVIIEGVSEDGRLIHYRGESVIRVE